MRSAVLLVVFNRPELVKLVFSRIKKVKPSRLYIACDGARPDSHIDQERIDEVKLICEDIDWPCCLHTLYRSSNLGCKLAVSSAITWFFENEEEGIILEDDCLPSDSFFKFCDEMLDLHRNNERIYLISGYNKQQRWKDRECDYFYSHLGGIWGWASWKRAWSKFDLKMSYLESMIETGFFVRQMGVRLGMKRQEQLLSAKRAIKGGQIDSWDYSWGYTRHINNGLSCVSSKSLIRNIGFGNESTHTFGRADGVYEEDTNFPLRVNMDIIPDTKYDLKFLQSNSFMLRILSRLRKSTK